jgi:predicted RNA methylase
MQLLTSTLEAKRLELQAQLDALKSKDERNELGQFATPSHLAKEIVRYSVGLLPARETVRFLDPALGTGSFFSALSSEITRDRIEAAVGYEIDPHYGQAAKELWSESSLSIHLADFTTAPSTEFPAQFNLVVCNPPYVRHHHLEERQKLRLLRDAGRIAGMELSGLSGLYCYFLGISHDWLSDNAISAWLIPSEFMDVNYGKAVKSYLLDKVTLLRIHRFDPEDLQFEDALVSSAVVWFQNSQPSPNHEVEFTFGGTIEEPRISKLIGQPVLRQETKWSRFPALDVRSAVTGTTIGDLFYVKRGLATGSNEFFIVSEKRAKDLAISVDVLTPILPSPRYLETDEVFADECGAPRIERRLFLLDCRLSESELKKTHPALWEYFESGREAMADRYLCRTRSPWYVQENRPAPPFLCTYMGRSTNAGRPFRFILNHSRATAANSYLLLYPKPELAAALQGSEELNRKVWRALNEISTQSIIEEGRVYGGGLYKLEPKELANVNAHSILEALGQSTPKKQTAFAW